MEVGDRDHAAAAVGAHGLHVRIQHAHGHCHAGELRVPRLVGAFACGRIVNPLTARSRSGWTS